MERLSSHFMLDPDPLIGRSVELISPAGIAYRGVVTSIRPSEGLGELFVLGSADGSTYQRLVYVEDRVTQIRDVESGREG